MIDGQSPENIRACLNALQTACDVVLARIREWEVDNLTDDNCRDWMGHVQPALEQMEHFVKIGRSTTEEE